MSLCSHSNYLTKQLSAPATQPSGTRAPPGSRGLKYIGPDRSPLHRFTQHTGPFFPLQFCITQSSANMSGRRSKRKPARIIYWEWLEVGSWASHLFYSFSNPLITGGAECIYSRTDTAAAAAAAISLGSWNRAIASLCVMNAPLNLTMQYIEY